MAAQSSQQATVSPPASSRKQRPTRIGFVKSDARNKTIAVTVSFSERHPKYGKYLRRETVLHAHDEKNEAKIGDKVEICECRPISKTKHWRLTRVVTKSAGGAS